MRTTHLRSDAVSDFMPRQLAAKNLTFRINWTKTGYDNRMRKLFTNFLKCGVLGWCLEILFTALQSLRRRELTLKGTTSLWMFPIYGAGCLLTPLFRLMRLRPWPVRGLFYAGLIFTGEYLSGKYLQSRDLCPWDYQRARWNVERVIRLDYIPCWIATGLLMERATTDRKSAD